jgi:hypothetical protein
MKRFLMLVGVAVVAAAMYVAASPASQQSRGPTAKQFKALKKQVTTLSKTVKALKADEAKVKIAATNAAGFIADCLVSTNAGALPINDFGSATGTGYLIGTVTGGASSVRTALDVDSSTPFNGAYVQAVDPACITSSAASHALTRRLPLRAERSH